LIPNKKPREVKSHGTGLSGEFGISFQDKAHIMTILRDTLYSDKVLAVIREYSTNAWDAHKDAGKGHIPIKVTLPTEMEPNLSIRDFGLGLSQDDVFKVYTQYGASTKRSNDNTVGMLGIGCKSGFAYSDSFTIVSHHKGTKSTYVAVLDASESGKIDLLHEQLCDEKDTGVLIQIGVKPDDIKEFVEKAKSFFMYFQPRPDINTEIEPLPTIQKTLKNGVIYDRSAWGGPRWVAIMGCVPYRINLDQLHGKDLEGADGVPDFITKISGALYFDIGEVQISASREELKYSDATKKALVHRLNAVVDEYVTETLKGINAGTLTFWEKRVKARVLTDLGLPIPETCKEITATSIPIPWRSDSGKKDAPKTFEILHDRAGKTLATYIDVSGNSRLVVRNDNRALSGFHLPYSDYLVRRVSSSVKWDEFYKELDEVIAELGLSGITVLKTADMIWSQTRRGSDGKIINPKHRKKVFKLVSTRRRTPYSENWEAETREPTPDDVFVLISEFQAIGFDVFQDYQEDSKLAETFKIPIPPVYGYKSTGASPVDPLTVIGKYYPDWRIEWIKSLAALPKVREAMEAWGWIRLTTDYERLLSQESYYRTKGLGFRKVAKELGRNHPISQLIRNHFKARRILKKNKHPDLFEAIQDLHQRLGGEHDFPLESDKALAALRKTYPLLSVTEFSLELFWNPKHSSQWLQYVKLVDEFAALKAKHGTNPGSAAATASPVEGETNAGTKLHDDQRIDHGGLGGSAPHDSEGVTPVRQPEGCALSGALGGCAQEPDGSEEPGVVGAGTVHPVGQPVLS
jgi:hypothetical protein